MQPGPIRTWLYANWFYGGLVAGLFLLAITPLVWKSWSATLLVVFLHLPVYMLHQVEEHYRDRFRISFNQHMANGRNALTPDAVLVANLGGVWMVNLAALYLACFVRPGLGLIAIYLAIVNALVHIGFGVFLRAYNPGLVSAILLLLPAGALGWWILTRTAQCTVYDHAWGIGAAIAVHAAILVHVRLRLRRL